jgi:hypothetical protein
MATPLDRLRAAARGCHVTSVVVHRRLPRGPSFAALAKGTSALPVDRLSTLIP